MDTEERIRQALKIFRQTGATPEFNRYLQDLRDKDPLAFSVLDVYMCTMRYRAPLAIKKGTKLISRINDQPQVAWYLFLLIGMAHITMGEMESANSYLLRALEAARAIKNPEAISRIRFQICSLKFLKGEYREAHKELLSLKGDPNAWKPQRADYLLGVHALVKGYPAEALKSLDSFLASEERFSLYFGAMEMKGLTFRIMGEFDRAMEAFIESAKGHISYGSAYSAFPVAKALELTRLMGAVPIPRELQKLTRRALSLGTKGSWGEQAAAQEIKALLNEDDHEVAMGVYEATKNYMRAYQNIEAMFSGFTAAYLAWSSDSPIFTKVLKIIAPLVPLHPGFKKDPLLGGFIADMEPFLTKTLRSGQGKSEIMAYLIGQFRVLVDGKEIKTRAWRNNKAIRGLVYFLLSSKHRIPTDHLFYLLWPRRAYNKKSRWLLYKAIDTIRKNLGRRDLLVKNRDFYQLEGVWTDLEELENLLRLADAATNPEHKEEYLARARELAKGDLLPEFPYDRHINEYRQYYRKIKRRLTDPSLNLP